MVDSEDTRSIGEYLLSKVLQCGEIPKHVAVIMDGNRRYARKRGLPTIEGHNHGRRTFEHFVRWCGELGVKEITAYAFAIENYNREKKEVEDVMSVIRDQVQRAAHFLNQAKEQGGAVQLLGDFSLTPKEGRSACAFLAKETYEIKNPEFRVTIAFCYSARQEMARRAQRLKEGVENGEISVEDITKDLIQQLPHIRESRPVDLLIRTSGETRLSNFLLLEASEAMLEFVPESWPELSFWKVLKTFWKYQVFRKLHPRGECTPQLDEKQKNFLTKVRDEDYHYIASFDKHDQVMEEKRQMDTRNLLYYVKWFFGDQWESV